MRYVFIDDGDHSDEALGVGPFDTEQEAEAAGEGRTVMALLSPDEFAAQLAGQEDGSP